jgi:hypothetical protein
MHDYDPADDYNVVVKVKPEVAEELKAAVLRTQPTYRALGFKGLPLVYVVRGLRDHLAKYVDGTSSMPVIVIDYASIARASDKYDVSLDLALDTTLMHEYGHAYVETRGVAERHDGALAIHDEERLVEAFAQSIWYGEAPKVARRQLDAAIKRAVA